MYIPESEIEITASRSGGPGGQHVNKTSTRITLRWNVQKSTALTPEQKERAVAYLNTRLTTEGDLIIHNSSTRSQMRNKEAALHELYALVQKALYIPKKRVKTKIPKALQKKRLENKTRHGVIKKMRSKKFFDE